MINTITIQCKWDFLPMIVKLGILKIFFLSILIMILLIAVNLFLTRYPIYRIPTGPTLKDLDAWFLTYHTLHTPLAGNGSTQAPILVYPNDMDGGVPKISLPTFAMASYKLKGSIYLDTKWS